MLRLSLSCLDTSTNARLLLLLLLLLLFFVVVRIGLKVNRGKGEAIPSAGEGK